MAPDKSKYNIIKEGDKEYILASEVSDYAKEYLGTSFGVPSYRTIRYYVTENIIRRPEKLGRETYFELKYIISAIELIKEISRFYTSLAGLKKLMFNITSHNQIEEALDLVEAFNQSYSIRLRRARNQFIQLLATQKPSTIRLSEIEEKSGG